MTIEYGFCHCGCGNKTSICKLNNPKLDLVKGEPRKFLKGHHQRISPVDYIVEDHGYKTPCWVWQRGMGTKHGYGRMWHNGKQCGATRVYYERSHGPIPKDLELDHLCRFPPCVNPDHLEPVTATINQRRGVGPKLTILIVREIREAIGTQRELADRFGVSQMCICNVLRRNTWKDI